METQRVLPKYRILAAILISVVGLAACSSPTAATPPPPPAATPPPVTPPPPLSITCPTAVSGTSTTGAPVAVTFNAPQTSGGLAPIHVTCNRQSGTPFPVGTTSVECSASDAASQSASCTFNVIVDAKIPRLTKTKILAFGDSFTAGEIPIASSPSSVDVPNVSLLYNPEVAYPTRLAEFLHGRYVLQPQIEVINMGLHGETAEEGAKRLPSRISQNRPEVLLLLEGANDLSFYGSAGIQRAWVAIDTMAKEGRNRGLRVFIATLPPPRPGFRSTLPDGWITALNDRIRTTARSEGAYLVDIYGALSPAVTQYIGIDGLHPSEAGYRKMAETFFDAIRVDLEAR